ncbi:Lin-54 DREAM MuvB core complex component [Sparganum proliferum]
MLTSAASGHTTKPEPPAAPSTVGAATRGSLSLPSRSSLVKGVPVSAEGDGTSMGSVSLQRLVERDALEPAPHHTAADRRVLEILRRARDCAADLESESQGPPVKRRASNRNRSPAVVHTNDNSSSREMVGVPSTSKSNVAVPATGVTATTADSGFNIRPKISHVAAATTTASVSSVQRATNGIPSGPAKSAAAALTISSPIKFQVLKNGASTPSQLPNTLSTSQPAVPTSLTNPLTATKVATWTPTAPIPTSLSAPTQVSPLLSSSGRPLHIGLELILSNGVRIPISATCGLKPENNTQRPVTGTTGLTLPTLTSEQVTVAAKTVTIPVESTLQPAASSPPKSPNSVSPVTKNSKQTLASAAAATIPRKSSPGAATAYYNGEGGVVEDEELSDDPEVSVSADSKADLEATAGDNRSRICSCLRSNCLKLYCDCFAAGRACEGCHCRHCRNNLSDDITRRARDFAMRMALARNPRAFKPKIETNSGTEGKHLLGCRCKRSHCLKNYCECYLAKISCSKLCRCLSCSNANKKAHSKAGSSPTSSSSCSRSASCSGYSAPSEHEKACHDSRESSTTGGVKVLSATSLPATASFRTTAVDVPAQSIQTLNFPASSVTDRPTSIQSLLLSSPLVSPELLKCLRGQHVVVAATPALKGTSAPAAQISLLPGLSTASRVISLSTTTASTTTQSSVAACLSGNQTATSSNGVGNSFAALGRLIINGTATNQGCSTGSGAGGNCILVQTTTCSVPPKPQQQQQQQQPPPQPTASVYSEAAAAAAEVGCDEVPEPGTETVTVAAVDAPIDYSEYTEEELELMQSLLEENSVGNRVRPASIDAPSEHTPRARCCGLSPSQAVQNHLNKSVCPEINRALSSISPVDDSTDHMSIQLECNRTRPMSLPSMENSPESSPPASPRHHHPESYSLSAPASISSQPEWAIPRKVQSATSGNEDISVLVQKIRVLERRVAKLMHVVQAQGNALRDMSARVRHTNRCGCWSSSSSSSSVSNGGTTN